MAPPDVVLKALAAVVCGVFAGIVLAAAQRRRSTLALGGFLLLLAGNAAAEVFRGMAPAFGPEPFWHALAVVCACLDPVLLLAFVLLHTEQPGAARALGLSSVGAALLLVGVPFAYAAGSDAFFVLGAGLAVFTAIVYGASLVLALRSLRTLPRDPGMPFLAAALLFALFPRQGFIGEELLNGYAAWATHATGVASGFPYWQYQASDLLFGAVFGTVALWLVGTARSRAAAWGLVGGVTMMFVTKSADAAGFAYGMGLLPDYREPLVYVGRAASAIRWLGFGALASAALVRHDALGLSLQARRRMARVLIALTILTAGMLALVVLGAEVPAFGTSLVAPQVVILLFAVALSQGFRDLVDRVASRFYGVPLPGHPSANQEMYRAAAMQAVALGHDTTRDPALQRLRDEMGLDPATASLIERAAESSVAAPLAPGRLVGARYRLTRLVGRGGSGRAFLAHDERLDRDVVIKEVLLDGARGEDEGLREARLAGSVQHPHVVTVHDAIPRAASTLLVLEHASGGSLAQRLATGGIGTSEALRILRGVAEGLAAMHARGILHRDIKAENVLLTREGDAKIADFGLARLRRGETVGLAEGAAFAGTPETMAPEQRRGGDITTATDVYALGLLGRRLFPAPAPALAALFDAATREAPEARPTAAAFASELRSGPVHEERAPDAHDVTVT